MTNFNFESGITMLPILMKTMASKMRSTSHFVTRTLESKYYQQTKRFGLVNDIIESAISTNQMIRTCKDAIDELNDLDL